MATEPSPNTNCEKGVCNPQRTQGLLREPPRGEHIMVELNGPGVFLVADVSKSGGNSDLTFVKLDVDGRNVTALSFVAAENAGFTQSNPYGILLLRSNVLKTFTVGFPYPLRFEKNLKLSVFVDEIDVDQILANVIHGTV